jgi:ABC-type branched-subunit amino acid transport system ATPase component
MAFWGRLFKRWRGSTGGNLLITLTKARVLKYKSIEDSSSVEIADDVTVLVGKNESGKTAYLKALHKALPLGTAKFDFVFDYPRKDYVKYRPQHEAKWAALLGCIAGDLVGFPKG